MKHFIFFVLGFLIGAAILGAGTIYNPFVVDRSLSPLSLSDSDLIALNFSAVPSNTIVYTNNGGSRAKPFPEKVLQLWETPIRLTSLLATVMRDARGQTAGLGVKFSSHSERTQLLKGEALVDSVWYVYLPGRGSLFMNESENYWTFWREVVLPAYRKPANNWKGSWLGDLTAGPGTFGTAMVTGGSGSFQGARMEGVESLSVRAFSGDFGPVSADGRLLIELPSVKDDIADETSIEP